MLPVVIRRIIAAVFVGGIAGMIVGSIRDSNGQAITFGLVTAAAALCLITMTAERLASRQSPEFDEAEAQAIEAQIGELAASGSDEAALRDLVRRAVSFGSAARDR